MSADAMFDRYADAQGELISAGRLLKSAALALRSTQECRSGGPSAEVRASTLGLAEAAAAAIRRAAEMEADSRDAVACAIEASIYRAFGLVTVIVSALRAPQTVGAQDLNDDPVADALEIAADLLGEDPDEGLAGEFRELLHALLAQTKAQVPPPRRPTLEVVRPGQQEVRS